MTSTRATSFGAWAEQYDDHRPTYPDDAVDWLLPPHAVGVAEVGAGIHLGVEPSPNEIASALGELLAQPSYAEAAGRTAAAIAADSPDQTATEALLSLAEIRVE